MSGIQMIYRFLLIVAVFALCSSTFAQVQTGKQNSTDQKNLKQEESKAEQSNRRAGLLLTGNDSIKTNVEIDLKENTLIELIVTPWSTSTTQTLLSNLSENSGFVVVLEKDILILSIKDGDKTVSLQYPNRVKRGVPIYVAVGWNQKKEFSICINAQRYVSTMEITNLPASPIPLLIGATGEASQDEHKDSFVGVVHEAQVAKSFEPNKSSNVKQIKKHADSIAYWKFDRIKDSIAVDLSGSNNSAEIVGACRIISGPNKSNSTVSANLAEANDPRKVWISSSGEKFKIEADGSWSEVTVKSDRVRFRFTERNRTSEYVEFHDERRGYSFRVYERSLKMRGPGETNWGLLYRGRWQ